MRYSEAKLGRTFIIRLEDGEILHEQIERFAAQKNIEAAFLIAIGGADNGSTLVVGPEYGRAEKINPMTCILDNVHEICGTGTIFPDDTGRPVLHMHISCGRNAESVTGCVREGVKIWHVLEVILIEMTGTEAMRVLDKNTGFKLLDPQP